MTEPNEEGRELIHTLSDTELDAVTGGAKSLEICVTFGDFTVCAPPPPPPPPTPSH
jgi:bacteriocin-like protein